MFVCDVCKRHVDPDFNDISKSSDYYEDEIEELKEKICRREEKIHFQKMIIRSLKALENDYINGLLLQIKQLSK